MKDREYELLELEIIEFDTADIIVTSEGDETSGVTP